jgi:cobalamin biosynthesis protein CobT
VLFHNDLANTTEALPEVIAKLKSKGFEFSTVSELIYHDSYRIDRSGKQIFDADATAQIHTAGTQANAAFEIILQNLTIEEIMSLENGLSDELGRKLQNMLTREQLQAVMALSDDELQSAWAMLVEAKVTGNLPAPIANNNNDNDIAAITDNIIKGGGTGYNTNSIYGGEVTAPATTAAATDESDNTAETGTTLEPLPDSATLPDTGELPLLNNKY